MIIRTKFVRLIKAVAFTACPFILIDYDLSETRKKSILIHEWKHWYQQLLFCVVGAIAGMILWFILSWPPQAETFAVCLIGSIEGWVTGFLLWIFLYLFCLPVKWNPFRRYWETEAFKANGFDENQIKEILRKPPYYLT